MTIDDALPYLRCPVCAEALARAGEPTLRCGRGHAFDLARQGYASLTAGRTPHAGDSAAMIEARDAFLAAGHYAFLAEALRERARGAFFVEAGVGTGYYLGALLAVVPEAAGLGLDVSKPALRRAARCHPRAAAALADLWQLLPLRDACADLVLDVFAPRNGPEFHRILRPGGRLLVVTPAADHLRELMTGYGLIGVDTDKPERVAKTLGAWFTAEQTHTYRRELHLDGPSVRTLVGMTPSARHADLSALPAAATVTAAFDVTSYRPV